MGTGHAPERGRGEGGDERAREGGIWGGGWVCGMGEGSGRCGTEGRQASRGKAGEEGGFESCWSTGGVVILGTIFVSTNHTGWKRSKKVTSCDRMKGGHVL